MSQQGRAALVTGAAAGIGRQLALDLVRQGACQAVTIVDCNHEGAVATAAEVVALGGRALAVQADVSDSASHRRAFKAHTDRWGRLDLAILNAGIAERGNVLSGDPREVAGWNTTLHVNLRAVAEGVGLCVESLAEGGAILVVGSAGGLFPMSVSPVYSASKAGVIALVRSLVEPLSRRGIKISCLCPQFVDTALTSNMPPGVAAELMKDIPGARLLTTEQVSAAGMALLSGAGKLGPVLVVLANGDWVEPKRVQFKPAVMPSPSGPVHGIDPVLRDWASRPLPPTFQKIEVHSLSTDFRVATRLLSEALPGAPPPGHVIIQRHWTGVNASDINFSAGRYHGSAAAAERQLPLAAGFESVGVVVRLGAGVHGLAVGQAVATLSYGGYSEYAVADAKRVLPIPRATPELVSLLTSGLTASIGLEEAGRMGTGQTVLVTAAAGGTGQFAVQLAKLRGNHVIATCGSREKKELLTRLGCDRVICYAEESVADVLRSEYAAGVDLVYESVGGEMFSTAVNALAVKGRLVVIGMMSSYKDGWERSSYPGLTEKLLWKSASVSGFFLLHYARSFSRHLKRLIALLDAGKLRVSLDSQRFVGLESVPAAVDRLQGGRSVGKVVVQVARQLPPTPAAGAAAARL